MKSRTSHWVVLLSILGLGGALALPGCSDDRDGGGGTQQSASAQIQVEPLETIVFSGAIVGEKVFERVKISNVGDGELTIYGMKIDEAKALKEFSIEYETPPGVEFDEQYLCPKTRNFSLYHDPNLGITWCQFWVSLSVREGSTPSGALTIESNDTKLPRLEIALSASQSVPEITVDPVSVQFEDVEEGKTEVKKLKIFNTGKANLLVTSFALVSDAEGQFLVELSKDVSDGTVHEFPEGGVILKPSLDVASRDTMVVLIKYTPTRIGPAEGTLRILSNDPKADRREISIKARSIKPCIDVQPADGDFGDVAIGEAKDLTFDLTNCGNAPLVITEASLVENENGGTSQDFSILLVPTGLNLAENGRSSTGSITIEPSNTSTITLQYTPGGEGPDGGLLLLRTNVANKEELEIHLFGRGTTNTCPVAIGEARIRGGVSYDLYPDDASRLETIPLKTLELRGDRSNDPDGQVASHKWTVLERPDGSVAQLSPHESAPNPTFFLDLAGRYVFELKVIDSKGLPSCKNALVYVMTIPNEDIHIQLVWDTPADPDPTDQGYGAGSDLDIHLQHPLGDWFYPPWDCFYGDKNPDWGRPGDPGDDPSLDIDDTDGWGPENINLDNPENNRVYRVGVHYFNDHGYGASFATVRIFVQGIMRFEYPNKRMASTDYFWDVATIAWPGGNIQQIDNLMPIAPDNGGVRP